MKKIIAIATNSKNEFNVGNIYNMDNVTYENGEKNYFITELGKSVPAKYFELIDENNFDIILSRDIPSINKKIKFIVIDKENGISEDETDIIESVECIMDNLNIYIVKTKNKKIYYAKVII